MTEDQSETPETPETPEDDAESQAKKSEVKLIGKLSRDSDMAARPGFRSPSNARSKAQKKKRKKKKR